MATIHKHVTIVEEWVQAGHALEATPSSTLECDSMPAQPDHIDSSHPQPVDQVSTYPTGFDEGFQAGAQATQNALNDQINMIETLIQSIPDALLRAQDKMKDEMTNIVLMITQQFFVEQHHHGSIAQLVTNTLKHIHDQQNIQLALHPQDISRLQQDSLSIDLSRCNNLKIVPDESLTLGGCVIHNDHGVFNASIERQIDNLKTMLLDMRNRKNHAPVP